jgi:hypothetical protein
MIRISRHFYQENLAHIAHEKHSCLRHGMKRPRNGIRHMNQRDYLLTELSSKWADEYRKKHLGDIDALKRRVMSDPSYTLQSILANFPIGRFGS